MTHDNRRDRNEVQPEEVVAVFEAGEPMITEEIEDRLGVRHRAAVDELERLHDRGVLDRKRIGMQVAVWWMEPDGVDDERFEGALLNAPLND